MIKYFLAAAAAFMLVGPAAGFAQGIPSYAQPPPPAYGSGEENIHGRVTGFDGAYSLQVRDERGYIDNVRLHPGTIINPTGLTLAPGMVVSIIGYNAGDYFAANEIDTPYTFYAGVPYYSGHPWYYYGPSVSLSFFFGHPGWWHGPAFVGAYHWSGGVRVYNGPVRVYGGGAFHGRDYVAPPEHGGWYPHGGRAPQGARPEGRDGGHDDHDHR